MSLKIWNRVIFTNIATRITDLSNSFVLTWGLLALIGLGGALTCSIIHKSSKMVAWSPRAAKTSRRWPCGWRRCLAPKRSRLAENTSEGKCRPSHARESGQARKRAARPRMLDALGLRGGGDRGFFIVGDIRPPRTCPLWEFYCSVLSNCCTSSSVIPKKLFSEQRISNSLQPEWFFSAIPVNCFPFSKSPLLARLTPVQKAISGYSFAVIYLIPIHIRFL